MQLMPATGQSLKVGDITVTESNVHGGTKYMDQLMTEYSRMRSSTSRTVRCSRSPATTRDLAISRSCKEAEKRGLDPNLWFNNVEVVTAEKIGIETTTYVRNIFKYYVSYRLTQEADARAEKLKQSVIKPK